MSLHHQEDDDRAMISPFLFGNRDAYWREETSINEINHVRRDGFVPMSARLDDMGSNIHILRNPTYPPTSPSNGRPNYPTAFTPGVTAFHPLPGSSHQSNYVASLSLTPPTNDMVQSLEARRASRPGIRWIPDCYISVQEKHAVKGILWDSAFDCAWVGCNYCINRWQFWDCERYAIAVYKHLVYHATPQHPNEGVYYCHWAGCKSTTDSKPEYKRNRIRHISTHLPYYTLCVRCARPSARRDARGESNRCTNGTCEAENPRIKEGVEAAKHVPGYPDIPIAQFWSIAYRFETYGGR